MPIARASCLSFRHHGECRHGLALERVDVPARKFLSMMATSHQDPPGAGRSRRRRCISGSRTRAVGRAGVRPPFALARRLMARSSQQPAPGRRQALLDLAQGRVPCIRAWLSPSRQRGTYRTRKRHGAQPGLPRPERALQDGACTGRVQGLATVGAVRGQCQSLRRAFGIHGVGQTQSSAPVGTATPAPPGVAGIAAHAWLIHRRRQVR